MKRLIPLILLLSFNVFAQESFENSEPLIDEENLSVEEGSLQSEVETVRTDEVAHPIEAERPEDVLFPEGEDTAWSLGSDEIAADDLE